MPIRYNVQMKMIQHIFSGVPMSMPHPERLTKLNIQQRTILITTDNLILSLTCNINRQRNQMEENIKQKSYVYLYNYIKNPASSF